MATDRADLGALLHRLLAVVIEQETALLGVRGLQMWDYVVLTGLQEGAASTQAQLAAAVGRDKTRIIATLDRLQEAGLIDRQPDPRDRRNRVVSLTEDGRLVLSQCRAEVQVMEAELLAPLGPGQGEVFLEALGKAVAAAGATT